MNRLFLWVFIICVIVGFIYWLYRKNFKRLNVPTICLITGGVKVGKSLIGSTLARKDFKRRHRKWVFITWLRKKFKSKKEPIEEPLFYTNTFITFGDRRKKKIHKLDRCIVQIELEHLERVKRFNYGSVVFVDESSLLSDNFNINDYELNAEQSLFNKLFGHETKGGALYYCTQNSLDNHYSIKRASSTYFFIQKDVNFWLFRVLYVRELINDEHSENNFNDDVDTTTRKVFVGRWNYWKYDRYYYSYLTDNLPHDTKKPNWYKGQLNSFNPLYRKISLKGIKENEEEK